MRRRRRARARRRVGDAADGVEGGDGRRLRRARCAASRPASIRCARARRRAPLAAAARSRGWRRRCGCASRRRREGAAAAAPRRVDAAAAAMGGRTRRRCACCDAGADANANENGHTPLHQAPTTCLEAMRLLLEKGAAVDAKTKIGFIMMRLPEGARGGGAAGAREGAAVDAKRGRRHAAHARLRRGTCAPSRGCCSRRARRWTRR